MNEIEKMYENAGIDYEESYNNCTLNKEGQCELKCSCDICKYSEEKYIYPLFTAEKQIELIKWLAKRLDFGLEYYQSKTWVVQTQLGWDGYEEQFEHKNFDEALSGFINHLWQDLTEEEKEVVRGILRT